MRVLKAVPVILSALSAVFSTAVFAGVSEGQVIFDSFCVVCHGGLGEGETMGKPLVDSAAKNLTDAEGYLSYSNFAATILQPRTIGLSADFTF